MGVTQGMRSSEVPAAEKRSKWVINKLTKKLGGWKIHPSKLKHKTTPCKDGMSGFFAQTINLGFVVDEQKLTYKIKVEIRQFLTRLTLKNPNGMRLAHVEAKKDVVIFCEKIDKVLEKDFTRAIFDVQLQRGVALLNKHSGFQATLLNRTYDTDYDLILKISKNCRVAQIRKKRYGEVSEYSFSVTIRDGSYVFQSQNADGYEHAIHLGDPNLAEAIDSGIIGILPEICRQCYVSEAISSMINFDTDEIEILHKSLVGAGFSVPINDPNVQSFLTELDKAIAIITDIREKLK